jgi:hypothetical protein
MKGQTMIFRILAFALVVTCFPCLSARAGDADGVPRAESKSPLFALEGALKVHPKYLFKYYLTGFGDGQACALFGEEKLKNIKPGSLIHVEGKLGTRFHDGGSEKNLSPFGRTWFIYMDVETVRILREPEAKTK